jgi:hypothetical protein
MKYRVISSVTDKVLSSNPKETNVLVSLNTLANTLRGYAQMNGLALNITKVQFRITAVGIEDPDDSFVTNPGLFSIGLTTHDSEYSTYTDNTETSDATIEDHLGGAFNSTFLYKFLEEKDEVYLEMQDISGTVYRISRAKFDLNLTKIFNQFYRKYYAVPEDAERPTFNLVGTRTLETTNSGASPIGHQYLIYTMVDFTETQVKRLF